MQVFDASGLIATFNIPTTGAGHWWHVLEIDGASGAITEIDTIGDDPAPYPGTGAGCAATPASRAPGSEGKPAK